MTAYNFYKVSLCYREDMPLRSCRNCQRRTSCTSIEGKDWHAKWLDLAKCGCHLYINEKVSALETNINREKAIAARHRGDEL